MKRAFFIISIALLTILPSKHVYSQEMVDLGLPSGTLWKQCGENDYYTKYDALVKYSYELPTEKQIKELINNCTWSWQGGRYKVIGPNGNYIFMEAKGYKEVFDTKVYKSTDDISKTASDRRERGVYTSSSNEKEVGRQGVYVYAEKGSSTPKLFKFDYHNNSFLLDYSFDDKSSYQGKYSYRVSVHLVNSDNRAVKNSDNLFKQCERRGLPLTDIGNFGRNCENGQQTSIGHTDGKNDPAISVSVIKKNNQKGYWVCTWRYNFGFTIDGKINSSRSHPYPSNTIIIPEKIRLGDYEWRGEIASSYDYSRPISYLSDKSVWVNRVQITPPANVTKIFFGDGYINEALINLNYSSKVEEIHFPKSLRDFELFGMSSSDVLIFLPIKEPWEIIDGKRVPLFCGDESNTKFSEKCVFIVPTGSVEEYKKITRFKNTRIYTSIEEYKSDKIIYEERKREEKRKQNELEAKRIDKVREINAPFKDFINQNRVLFTEAEYKDELAGVYYDEKIVKEQIEKKREMLEKRQKIYDFIIMHSDVFSKQYYYESIERYVKKGYINDYNKIYNYVLDEYNKRRPFYDIINQLVGDWDADKRKYSCNISLINDQLYLTIKYKDETLFAGHITSEIDRKLTSVKEIKNGHGRFEDRYYEIVHSKITKDVIVLKVGWCSGDRERNYYFYYENGAFILLRGNGCGKGYNGDRRNGITFRK